MGRATEKGVAWFAPDSNFFLHCRQPEELDWSLVTESDEIVLMPMRTVQREIDSLKGQGNQRRAARARKVAALFGNLVSTEDVHVYREAGPRVLMRRAPRLDPARDKPAGFDADNADDRIVEEVMATAGALGVPVSFITKDSGPIQTAHDFGLPFHRTPDAWLLEPEPDPQARELSELKRRMDRMEGSGPRISVRAFQDDAEVDVLRGKVDSAADVSEEFIDKMTHLVTERRPIANPFEKGGVTIMVHSEWDKYRAAYQAWLAEVQARIKSLTEAFNATVVPLSFSLHLDNEGAEPADHVQVIIEAEGPIRLMWTPLKEAWLKREGRMFAEPPTRPDFPYANLHVGLHYGLLKADIRDAAGDCTAQVGNFTWVYTEPAIASERCTARAAELRHGLDGVSFDVHVVPAPGERDEVEGAILIRVSARNLPETFTKRLPVRIERQPNVVHARVLQRLEQEFNVIPD